MKELSPYLIHRAYPEASLQLGAVPPPEFIAPDRGPDLREYVRVIHRHLKLIVSLVAAALLVTALMVVTTTRIYTAKSTLLIEPQAPKVLDVREIDSEPAGSEEHDYFKTQEEILKSRSLAAQVIRNLGLETNSALSEGDQGFIGGVWSNLRSLLSQSAETAPVRRQDTSRVDDDLIDLYLQHLSVKPEIGTRLLKVAFSLPDPALAAQITNAHVRAYVRRGMEMHSQANEEAAQFLDKKLVELKERVEKSEAALNNYRRDRGIVAFTLDDKGTILNQRLTQLNQELTKAETERIDLEAQDKLVHARRYDAIPAVLSNPLITNLKAQNDSIESQYASMAAQFKPDYPPLQELKAKVDETRARLHAEIQNVVDGIESSYQTAVAREQELGNEVEHQKAKALALNDASLQDAVLAREVDASRQLYKSVLERMKEIGVAGQVPTSNVSIVDWATPPRHPSSPRPLVDLLVAGVLALFCGLGAAFILDHFDDGLHSPEEVEQYLGLPSLGSVPQFPLLDRAQESTAEALPAMMSDSLSEQPLSEAGLEASGREVVVSHGGFSAAGESFRAIRTAILLSRAEHPPKTILIASSTKSEGKTVVAVNIATAFAQIGSRVLLIDSDLRRSRCHETLSLDNRFGLTDALAGQKETGDVIQQVGERLSFLSAGSVPPNPTELLSSQKMRQLLAELSEQYDQIVIDSPPIMPVADSVILSRLVDGVLVVIGPRTPKQMARFACTRLSQVQAKILGVILNQVRNQRAGYYHYYGYGSYEDYASRSDAAI
jgi:capsular exopolysaccharide synthesis family protein